MIDVGNNFLLLLNDFFDCFIKEFIFIYQYITIKNNILYICLCKYIFFFSSFRIILAKPLRDSQQNKQTIFIMFVRLSLRDFSLDMREIANIYIYSFAKVLCQLKHPNLSKREIIIRHKYSIFKEALRSACSNIIVCKQTKEKKRSQVTNPLIYHILII